jgi:hypothetical protein
MDTRKTKLVLRTQNGRGIPLQGNPYEKFFSEGAGSSGAPLRGPVATSKPAVEISAKGRDEIAVRNLPEVKLRTPLLGGGSTDTTAGS